MISVIIPAYKKTDELVANLRHNLRFLDGCEVMVVNDNPEASIQKELAEFQHVKVIENPTNLGFAGAANAGIQKATGSHIMMLNSDVLLHNTDYTKALVHFETKPMLFAVAFAQQESADKIVGKNTIRWRRGMLIHSAANPATAGITGWAEGGAALFSTAKMKELGGFDEAFRPFYWEDIDLSFRAWKRGYEVYFDPAIVVEHHHESTIGAFYSSKAISRVAYRNQFLCIWKNITNPSLRFKHFFFLPFHCVSWILKGEGIAVLALFDAIGIYLDHGMSRSNYPTRLATEQISDMELLHRFLIAPEPTA